MGHLRVGGARAPRRTVLTGSPEPRHPARRPDDSVPRWRPALQGEAISPSRWRGAAMTALDGARPTAVTGDDVLLTVGVAALLLVGSGVSLEDDWQISVSESFSPFLPSPTGLALLLAS